MKSTVIGLNDDISVGVNNVVDTSNNSLELYLIEQLKGNLSTNCNDVY